MILNISPKRQRLFARLGIPLDKVNPDIVKAARDNIGEWLYPFATCKKCKRYPCYEGQDIVRCDCAKYGCRKYQGRDRKTLHSKLYLWEILNNLYEKVKR